MDNYSYSIAWSATDGEYVATSAEFPGLSGLGTTAEDAVRELRAAIEVAVAALAEDGEPIPQAQHIEEFSGQFRLRLPRSQHAQLVARAQIEDVSLNSLVQTYVSAGLAGDFWASLATQRLHSTLVQVEQMLTMISRGLPERSGNALPQPSTDRVWFNPGAGISGPVC